MGEDVFLMSHTFLCHCWAWRMPTHRVKIILLFSRAKDLFLLGKKVPFQKKCLIEESHLIGNVDERSEFWNKNCWDIKPFSLFPYIYIYFLVNKKTFSFLPKPLLRAKWKDHITVLVANLTMGVRQNWLVRICILTDGRAYQIGNSVPRKEWQQMNDTSLKMKLLRLGAETTHPKEKRRRNDKEEFCGLWWVSGAFYMDRAATTMNSH